jgi:tetratricopeptide (TPR) repeat protein
MRIICTLLFCISTIAAISQSTTVDSLSTLVKKEKVDTTKAKLLHVLAWQYYSSKPDTALKLLYQALQLAEKADHIRLKIEYKMAIGYVIGLGGNYVKDLQLTLEAKELAERYNYPDYISNCYHELGNNYKWQKNFKQAAIYYNKVKEYNVPHYTTEMNLGIVYLHLGKLDSALEFASAAYQHCLKSPEQTYLSTILANLGRIHQKMGNVALGRNYLAMAETLATDKKGIRNLGFVLLDLSAFFKDSGAVDSAIYCSNRILTMQGMQQFKPHMLDAAHNLFELYTSSNTDSAFKYLKLATALKEDLLGAEKTQEILTLRYEEELRQQQLSLEKIKLSEERNNNLQYAGITLALILFVILFFLFSHSIIANQKVIRFLGVIALLIVFEFLNLLLHPWLGAVTHHSPVLMLLAMVCVAALLIPLHHKLEHWITHKLVEKNKTIRLSAAKKIIATLEA